VSHASRSTGRKYTRNLKKLASLAAGLPNPPERVYRGGRLEKEGQDRFVDRPPSAKSLARTWRPAEDSAVLVAVRPFAPRAGRGSWQP
jgi:hypothetical protein